MIEDINYLAELFDDSPIGILIVDENFDIVMCNDFLFKLFKAKPENYIGKRFGNVFKCVNTMENKELCGTTLECNVCSLRNGVLSILSEKGRKKEIIVGHKYLIGDELRERKLKVRSKLLEKNFDNNILVTFEDITDLEFIEKSLHKNEIMYKQLFDNMTQAFALYEIITDEMGKPVDYKFLEVNKEYERITGLKKEEIIGKSIKVIVPDAVDYSIVGYGDVALNGVTSRLTKYYMQLDKYFDIFAYSPQKGQFATILNDITEIVNLEKELRASELKFKNYYEFAPDAIFIVDENGDFLDVNKATVKLTGYSRHELLNMSLLDIISVEDREAGIFEFNRLCELGELESKFAFITKNNLARIFSIKSVKLEKDRYISFAKDLTEKYEFEKKLRYEYYHDSMTGLYNRKYVFDNLHEIDNENNLPLSLVLADINGLRSINESLGFLVGDQIIIAIANAIKNTSGDFISSRWSGDDFLIILPNTNLKVLSKFMKRFKEEVKNQLPEELNKVKISYGSYIKMSEDLDFEQALNFAELNLLENKTTSSGSIQNTPINMILHTLHEKNMREEMHSKRVSKICVAIGKEMNYEKDDLNKLKIIGLVHDIGKIGIDEYVLNKPGKLSDDEFDLIKKHPEIGFRILSANKNTSELAFYVLSHHERLDGRGYPNGIKGSDISIFTRILTIADSYDAMTSERTYRDTLTSEEAIGELLKYSGSQFDENIVNVFINKVLNKDYDFNVQ
ncbi:MAG: PAS domain S-box protein [Firmicutes bacterium]|nr:PAS domain S-box protein [Bacillota bacterium]